MSLWYRAYHCSCETNKLQMSPSETTTLIVKQFAVTNELHVLASSLVYELEKEVKM